MSKQILTQPALPDKCVRDVAALRSAVPKALRKTLANDPSANDIKIALDYLKAYDPLLKPVAVDASVQPEEPEEQADLDAIEGETVQEEEPIPLTAEQKLYNSVLDKLPFQEREIKNRPERSFDVGRNYDEQ